MNKSTKYEVVEGWPQRPLRETLRRQKITPQQIALIFSFVIAFFFNGCNNDANQGYSNADIDGFVPDGETAIRIAEAVWLPIYGSEIKHYKPFTAELLDSVWHVKGDRHAEFGGIIHLYIGKRDAKVHRFKREK